MTKLEDLELQAKAAEISKTIKELEKLEFELNNSKAEKAASGKYINRIFRGIKSWSAILLVILGGGTAMFKFYEPIAKKIELEKSQYETRISKDMLDLVKDFNSNAGSTELLNVAALSLSAYESDAMPYILLNLESYADHYEICARSLKLIKGKKHTDEDVFYATIIRFFNNYIQFTAKDEPTKLPTIQSYIHLMVELDFFAPARKMEGLNFLNSLETGTLLTGPENDALKPLTTEMKKIINYHSK